MKEMKSLIPSDKPKSWVLGILSGLVCLLIAGPILIAGMHYEITTIRIIGQLLFVCCWLLFAVAWLVFLLGLANGKYITIEKKEWKDQLW